MDYGKLFYDYIEVRKQVLNITKPFYLYFSQAIMVDYGTYQAREFKGINALTGEPVPKGKGIKARGGANSNVDMYASVDISGRYNFQTGQYNQLLSPAEKCKAIIRILFTVEHELRHEEKRQDLSKNIVTPETIKLAKSMVFFDFWEQVAKIYGCAYPIVNGNKVDTSYMYLNAHDFLFIEQDANRKAYEELSNFLKRNGAA